VVLGLLLSAAVVFTFYMDQYLYASLGAVSALGLLTAGILARLATNEYSDWLDEWEHDRRIRKRRGEHVDLLFDMPVPLWITSWLWIWGGAFFVTAGIARASIFIKVVVDMPRFNETAFALMLLTLLCGVLLASYLMLAGFQLRYAVPKNTLLNAVIALLVAGLSSLLAYLLSHKSSRGDTVYVYGYAVFALSLLATAVIAVLFGEDYRGWRDDVEREGKAWS